jgi:hypothetical protein
MTEYHAIWQSVGMQRPVEFADGAFWNMTR